MYIHYMYTYIHIYICILYIYIYIYMYVYICINIYSGSLWSTTSFKMCMLQISKWRSRNIFVLRMYMYTCRYMFIYMYVHIFLHIYTYTHISKCEIYTSRIYICMYIYKSVLIHIHTNICIHLYSYTHTCMYIHMYIYVYTYIYVYVHICICAFLYKDTCICTYRYIYTYKRDIHIYIYTYVCTCMNVLIYIHIYVCICVKAQKYIHCKMYEYVHITRYLFWTLQCAQRAWSCNSKRSVATFTTSTQTRLHFLQNPCTQPERISISTVLHGWIVWCVCVCVRVRVCSCVRACVHPNTHLLTNAQLSQGLTDFFDTGHWGVTVHVVQAGTLLQANRKRLFLLMENSRDVMLKLRHRHEIAVQIRRARIQVYFCIIHIYISIYVTVFIWRQNPSMEYMYIACVPYIYSAKWMCMYICMYTNTYRCIYICQCFWIVAWWVWSCHMAFLCITCTYWRLHTS